ncbi:MAG: ADOP family duplicated permease [Longimicrobiales bacterium]
MSIVSDLVERLRALVLRHREEAELDEELRFHLEMEAAQQERMGVPAVEARRRAHIALGGVERTKEDVRDARGTRWLEDFSADIRFALRSMRRTPAFAAALLFMLAIGIGASSTIFTLINAISVRRLPVMRPKELVAIGDPNNPTSWGFGVQANFMSYPLYRDIRAHSSSLSGVFATGPTDRLDVAVGPGAELEHPAGRFVSDNYFSVLGVGAARGRVFDGTEDQVPGAAPVVVISDGWWARRFSSDPAIIGRTVGVNGTRMTIVGVTPPAFTGEVVGQSTDVWLPASMHDVLKPRDRLLDRRNGIWLLLLGRLAPGRTLADVRAELEPFIIRTIAEHAGGDGADFLASNPRVMIGPGERGFSAVRGEFTTPLLTLMMGVLLLLAIICANIANLLLARAVTRTREMTVRLALGAQRSRIMRMLLTESLVLAAMGGTAGLLLAYWGSRALVAVAAAGTVNAALDVRVLSFTLLLSVVTAGVFGLAPALLAARSSTLISGTRGLVGRAAPARGRILIATQVGLSVVLLVGASMLTRSIRNMQSIDVGLDRDHLLMLDVDVKVAGYHPQRVTTIAREIRDRVGAIAGVGPVAYSENGIFSGTEWGSDVTIPGRVLADDDAEVGTDNVSAGYVAALGGRLLAGRDIEPADQDHLPRVAIVNASFASFYFPGQSVVGRQFVMQDTLPITIVGVVADMRGRSLTATRRRAYFPYVAADTTFTNPTQLRFAIRTSGDLAALVGAVRAAVVAIDPLLPIDGLEPLSTLMRQSIKYERLTAQLASAFSILALLLASVGLYAVMTYAVRRRTGEIGLRTALGARREDVLNLVLSGALRLLAAGMLVGVTLALVMGRVLHTQLYDVAAVDALSVVLALAVLGVSAAVATLLPALSATRVSPLAALRSE